MRRAILVAAVMLLGVCLVAYPHVANYLSSIHAATVAENYDASMAEASKAELDAMWEEGVAYNESLSGNPVHDPFLEGSGWAMSDNYYQVLDADGEGTMGYVTVPKISVKLPVYHGTAERALQNGAGHLEGSSMPVGGEGTHAVLTGHSGLSHAKMFTDLTELAEGDQFYLHILDRVLAYEVDQVLVVEPEDVEALKRVDGRDLCTLVTCTPYGVNTHRLLVRGHRVDYMPDEELRAAEAAGLTREQVTLIASALGAAAGVGAVYLVARRRLALRADGPGAPTSAPAGPPRGGKAVSLGEIARRRRGADGEGGGFWWEDE